MAYKVCFAIVLMVYINLSSVLKQHYYSIDSEDQIHCDINDEIPGRHSPGYAPGNSVREYYHATV